MNTLDTTNTQHAVMLSGTLALPVSTRRNCANAPIENWRKRIYCTIEQCRVSQKTAIIVISSKKQPVISVNTNASIQRSHRNRSKVAKALLLANKIDRQHDPLRTLGYADNDKKHVYLESLYR